MIDDSPWGRERDKDRQRDVQEEKKKKERINKQKTDPMERK